jgi:P27 family predicted phage terminase small subunit
MKGRPPKPTEQKKLEGNPGRRPLPEPVIVAGRGSLPAPPDDVPPEGHRLWDTIVAELERVNLVDRIDYPALIALCTQWARAEKARRVLAQEGMFALGSMGQIVEHPALAIERNAHALFLRFAEHYALTPVARARIGLAMLEGRKMQEELQDRIGRSPRRTGADDAT